MTLSLKYFIDQRDNLGTGLQQFCLGQYTSATKNILKSRVDQYQVITGRGKYLTLYDSS